MVDGYNWISQEVKNRNKNSGGKQNDDEKNEENSGKNKTMKINNSILCNILVNWVSANKESLCIEIQLI